MPQFTDWGDLTGRHVEDIAYTRALEIGRTVLNLPGNFPESAILNAMLTELGNLSGDLSGAVTAAISASAAATLAAAEAYTDAAIAGIGAGDFVLKAGDSMTGPLNITANVAEKLGYFRNTNVGGFGLRLQNGIDTNYTLKISDSAGVDRVQVFGDGLTVSNYAAPFAAALESTLRRGGHWHYSAIGGGDAGEEIYISNQSADNASGVNSQYGGASHLATQTIGGWDGGSRGGINFYYDNSTGGGHLYETYRPTAIAGFASDGSWAYNWSPGMSDTYNIVADTTFATSNAPYTLDAGDLPYYIGQTIVLDGGAYWMRTATIAAQRKQWPLQFAVTPDRATDLPGIVALKLLAGVADIDRVQLFVNGALRTITQKDFTALAGGDKVLCYT